MMTLEEYLWCCTESLVKGGEGGRPINVMGGSGGGGPGDPGPPCLGHYVGFLTLGPKLDPHLDPHFCL